MRYEEKNRYQYIFNKVFDMSEDGFIVVDPQGIVTDINERYCNFFKITKEQVIGKSILNIIPNSKMLDIVSKTYTEESVVHTYIAGAPAGEKVIVSRSYVEDEVGKVIAGVAQVKFKVASLETTKRLLEEYSTLNYYKEQYTALQKSNYGFDSIIGNDTNFVMQKLKSLKVAKTSFSILLTGETGTGKEVFARAIHNSSERSKNPMISINCAAIPNDLLESELFGYEEGAFTGAKKGGKKGKFLLANRSTIFLDEIGDMPLPMQAKLLRVLEEKKIDPIGSIKSIPVDIRVISATKKNLQKMVLDGEFREDLFYRLNVINIEMIPLRNRRDDILLLSEYFLNKLNNEYRTNIAFSPEVQLCFYSYDWPGNIRELDNVIKSAYAVCNENFIQIPDLPSRIVEFINHDSISPQKLSYHEAMNQYQEKLLKYYLKQSKGNIQKAAKLSKIHPSLFYKKIQKYQLNKHKFTED
ncbi:AAA family ATPase [Fusobacterium necrophorum subsp. funduliforme]|uniref:sigma-54 interaction domain-containing protein n=1 Tax=Fusobacterium necrophorum TaxID=859 RepID=UPI000786AA7B|nr:sigma 54-interacting transcriptional regulator [Fusobacterium necrophorum]KYM37490.1 AAA family ATPase [Fusobacterium necrophorum subsp. funduliforme]KYM47319.1 AAA family ATPase [Fusobacterium necrophorum subsp. funduliforme]KYM49468.1 AAA family ATPase [Fusobacterium necrophorum subsp. funduliforme]KYM58045.1 AAA family ATPase [Fusobacterium necrophorum subsp. funduliforme]